MLMWNGLTSDYVYVIQLVFSPNTILVLSLSLKLVHERNGSHCSTTLLEHAGIISDVYTKFIHHEYGIYFACELET